MDLKLDMSMMFAMHDPAYGYQRFGDIVDELVTKPTAHLAHEESDGLALIDASLSLAEWQHFAQVHTERVRSDAPTNAADKPAS